MEKHYDTVFMIFEKYPLPCFFPEIYHFRGPNCVIFGYGSLSMRIVFKGRKYDLLFNKTSQCGRDMSSREIDMPSREINVRRFCANIVDPNQTHARCEFSFCHNFFQRGTSSRFFLLTYLSFQNEEECRQINVVVFLSLKMYS